MQSHQPAPPARSTSKVFIIGLPRTGTTSVSVALLEMGLRVAHQAFTKQAVILADAISDAPCFSDYPQLHSLYPDAKFVYLDRPLDAWVPSMQMLLSRMLVHLEQERGRFHPLLKRSFGHTFGIYRVADPMDAEHLKTCYQVHKQQVFEYFHQDQRSAQQFLSLQLEDPQSLPRLANFIGLDAQVDSSQLAFPHLNRGRNVASWDEYKHELKINSNLAGPENRKYFNYKI
ncbi:sulfotransferase family protein [Shewanella rhizosphaerae]|uniref:sulfotransferase family protein n=1 Tax=Shewanella rhizosphaerae TaxID=2864207 RepID=UPI001C65F3DF|nr:sulfotransferase family protein [Shewanella rhizosphaerae]QYK12951.1 sulfotransferase family protein [Shewanella rhizosphaerae]